MQIVLGSRSPRRLKLLQHIISPQHILVRPPRSSHEPGFADTHEWNTVCNRLQSIAADKCDDVWSQIRSEQTQQGATEIAALVTADTVIVASEEPGRWVVLGQPPQDESWQTTVRRWFTEYLAGRTHFALTALCVQTPARRSNRRIVESEITFRSDVQRWLDWYIATGESVGKAGGYAVQGAGSIFVERVQGSLSNVIGLPLEALLEAFAELNIDLTSLSPAVNEKTANDI